MCQLVLLAEAERSHSNSTAPAVLVAKRSSTGVVRKYQVEHLKDAHNPKSGLQGSLGEDRRVFPRNQKGTK